jgi:FkbH-like protein
MWQTDWADGSKKKSATPQYISDLVVAAVDSVYLLHWNEHCLECAVPDCFKVCALYLRRRDRKCARFTNGIFPNPQYRGLFPFGADVEFRRWGKLESTFGFGAVKPEQAQLLDQIDRTLLKGVRSVSSLLRHISPYYRLNGAYAVCRERFLQVLTRRRREMFDEFVVEAWNLHSDPVRLVIECWQDALKFRSSVLLEPGRAIHRIPVASMNVDLYGPFGVVRVYPDNDVEAHVVFTWLDFVRYAGMSRCDSAPSVTGPSGQTMGNVNRVKCVIWDLDGTVWDGILGEQDPGRVCLRAKVLQTMTALDEKGILQSIASKNDHAAAWSALQRLGIAHLFLYPAINWQPKSSNIRQIVDALNVGVDTCAFVDDSTFERAEVSNQLPEIRTYTDADVPTLLERPEFDVPITKESRQRRMYYTVELDRRKQALDYGDNYEAFLKTCKMEAKLFAPTEREHIQRCLELLHRSNQLNLSTHRYTREEFEKLVGKDNVVCICTSCRDRFGDYGLVGFASMELHRDILLLKDFVLSCRVAQKKLENAWFTWLILATSTAGYAKIRARYVKSSRNGVLLSVLKEVGFVEAENGPQGLLLELGRDVVPPAAGVVSVNAHSVGEIPLPFLTGERGEGERVSRSRKNNLA